MSNDILRVAKRLNLEQHFLGISKYFNVKNISSSRLYMGGNMVLRQTVSLLNPDRNVIINESHYNLNKLADNVKIRKNCNVVEINW